MAADFRNVDMFMKILMLGDSGAGKTSLISRFFENRFSASTMLTIGVDFREKCLVRQLGKRKVTIRFQVFDTAGQERFRTITPQYFRNAHGVVIAYDVTSRAQFDSVSQWAKDVSEKGTEDIQRILIGNKADLESHREVPREEGERLAKSFGMGFSESSALLGENVEELFTTLADQVLSVTSEQALFGRSTDATAMTLTTTVDGRQSWPDWHEDKQKCC